VTTDYSSLSLHMVHEQFQLVRAPNIQMSCHTLAITASAVSCMNRGNTAVSELVTVVSERTSCTFLLPQSIATAMKIPVGLRSCLQTRRSSERWQDKG
jgi:hypothetical protein